MKLRPIQQQAIDSTLASFKRGGTYHLVQAPVAFGKTIFASALMRSSLEKYSVKCIFLAHLTELVQQTHDKFIQVAPDLASKTAIFSSSLAQKDVGDITIGSRQSVARGLKNFGKVHLIICDECHLMSEEGQWDKIFNHFLALNPRLRIVGLSGTPFRLGSGFIYGEGKRWDEPCFKTGMEEMIKMGYLSKFRYKVKVVADLSGIPKVGGELHQGQMGEVMSEGSHMGSVKKAIDEHAKDRKHIIVFAVNIYHAERLAEFLGCECVHSRLGADLWRKRVDAFKSGEQRILVNVSQLSIGFDAPETDCVIMARKTLSPALYVQKIGRGLRVAEGKKDCVILDLVGNYFEHGNPCDPNVKEKEKSDKDPEMNICPECFELVHPLMAQCPSCWCDMDKYREERERKKQADINKRIEMEEIDPAKVILKKKWVKEDHRTRRGNLGRLFCLKVEGEEKPWFRFVSYTSKQKGIGERFEKLEVGRRYAFEENSFGKWIN